MDTLTVLPNLSPDEQVQAEQALRQIIAATRQRKQALTTSVVEAVLLYQVMRQAADDVEWARHLLALARAHRWPDFSAVLRREGVPAA